MRAETVIATHGNTDFDAFAAMLAARRLYPGAVVAIGSLNRNVREFYRLHADELEPIVEIGRLETDAIRRLVVVETREASRLGELEAVALDRTVEKSLFDHHGDELPEWVHPEAAVLSSDGAMTTTLVGILAERELMPTALEATTFALGIHEDTGSLTYATTTQRDADALVWCLRHGARQDLVASYLHLPLAAPERDLLQHLLEALEPVDAGGQELLLAAVRWPAYVEGVSNLAHKTSRTPAHSCSWWRWKGECSRSFAVVTTLSTPQSLLPCSEAEVTRKLRRPSPVSTSPRRATWSSRGSRAHAASLDGHATSWRFRSARSLRTTRCARR